MPKVGNKSYGYGAKGMAAAKKASAKTGKPMKMAKKKSSFYLAGFCVVSQARNVHRGHWLYMRHGVKTQCCVTRINC